MELLLKNNSYDEEKSGYVSIPLDAKDVAAAKSIVSKFFDNIENTSKEKNLPELYYHVLLITHLMSEELIAAIGTENLKTLLSK